MRGFLRARKGGAGQAASLFDWWFCHAADHLEMPAPLAEPRNPAANLDLNQCRRAGNL